MEEGNIIEWLKKEGESVEPGDILAEVETDKATMELESFFSGTLIHIGVKEGAVPVDGIIAIIGDPSDDVQKLLAEAQSDTNGGGEKAEAPSEAPAPTPASAPSNDNKPAPAAAPAPSPAAPTDDRIKASPLAKKMAADAGIDLNTVQGSGEGGRIVKRDVEEARNRPAASQQSLSVSARSDFQYGSVPVSQMRKTIARRLGESKFTAPHFYLTVEINMDDAVSARKQMNEFSEVRISYNDMVVKACALALKQHPQVNASWTGDSIVYHPMVNIGVAVAIDEGLVVPVINDANLKPLSMLNTEIKHLAGLARDRKLGLDQMQGNTFTISNLGMFDIEEFTAIINPPDSCILAVGSIIQKPIVKDGEIKVGNMMKVTLSCDHRIVDGATGAKFLQTVKALLESPYRMLV
jgi:pyruvate dehydrogenase E2 component (dihydrolipoamide acetyltransferase)